jgi:predicted secreted protein
MQPKRRIDVSKFQYGITMPFAVALCTALFAGTCSAAVSADTRAAEVGFSVTASTEVPNTRLRLLLQAIAQKNGGEQVLPGLASQLNQRMNSALRLIEGTPGVNAQTRGLHSSPVYDKGKQVGWRLIGRIEAVGDAGTFPQLAGKLQAAGLSIESVQAEPAEKALGAARQEQTKAAIRDLKRRARVVSQALGCSAWSFAEVNLSDEGSRPPVGLVRMAAVKAEPAALAPGATKVAVRATAKMRCEP